MEKKKRPYKFNHIAKFVAEARLKAKVSQTDLARALGFKNGQYISNVERGKCSVPLEKIDMLLSKLKCSEKDVIEALMKDYDSRIRVTIDESRALRMKEAKAPKSAKDYEPKNPFLE